MALESSPVKVAMGPPAGAVVRDTELAYRLKSEAVEASTV